MEIQSRKNDKVQHLKKLASSASYRREQGLFYGDGHKLLTEALKWGIEVRDVFYTDELPQLPDTVSAYKVTGPVMEHVSPMKTPQNVAFSAVLPAGDASPDLRGALVLENMQDPGNVGTMLRTANAFGMPMVILVGACADPWSPKTLRAGMGAAFRQKTACLTLEEFKNIKTPDVTLYGAALGMESSDLREASLTDCAVAVGNEGSGLTDEFLNLCDKTLIIPMSYQCESLNAAAAAAVIMWEMRKNSI